MPIPAGWKPDPDDTTSTFYIATQTLGGEVVRFTVNSKTGDYSIKSDTRGDVVTYNAKDDRVTYLNDDFKTKVQKDNIALSTIRNIVPQRINEINKTLSQTEGSGIDSQDREEFLEGDRYRRIEETVADEDPDHPPQETKVNVSDIADGAIKNKPKTRGFGSLYYPSTLEKNTQNQDIIKFTVGTYKRKKLTLNGNQKLGTLSGDSSFNNDPSVFFKGKDKKEGPTEIFLPIQPSITDSNTVDWNENRLNPLQVGLLQSGVTIMEEGSSGIPKTIKELENTFEKNPELINAGKLLLAQEAVGAKNVLSRFGGGIVNPNLELLFNGPQLRPFNFNFRLSPRKEAEAQQVRTIIRAFKQSMAVKKSTGLFLVTPNVFKIEYLRKNNDGYDPHPSLNRIKTCALKSCVVDYTPENSYATYNDENNTMVSYNMSLQFQELEPVTDADYLNDNNSGAEIPPNHIGY